MPKHDVAVVGIGQTKFKSKRRDGNIPEMIYEAVKMALDDAQLEPKDIDAALIINIFIPLGFWGLGVLGLCMCYHVGIRY